MFLPSGLQQADSKREAIFYSKIWLGESEDKNF